MLRRVISLFSLLVCIATLFASLRPALGQQVTANAAQELVFAGLRSVGMKGQINGVATDSAGDIYLACDQGDGVRILKVANDGSALLGQVQLGAKGDSAVALALDPAGNVYVTGTSTSGQLSATNGAAIGQAVAHTTNSFVAKLDSNLTEIFLSFTGGSRIAAAALAASSDAVFVTGITYGSDLPVTGTAIEPAPAYGSLQNGFVEQLSADGATLVYATYLTGALGDTTPTGIAVDALDDAWIVGSTSASGFPTINALIPDMLSNPSGFVVRLTPAGDDIVFSTFVSGTGLNSIALDSTGQTLLISGAVNPGQFPVDTVLSPILPGAYQVLLRMPLDGSSVLSGTLIAQGSQSVVAAAPGGAAWVAGEFLPGAIPQLPQPPFATIGSVFAARVTQTGAVDQVIRLGGIANQQQSYASIPVTLHGLAVDETGAFIAGGAVQPTASSSLLATETYDLPLLGSPSAAFPSPITDAEASSATCNGSLCSGSAAYLAKSAFQTSAPALTFSTGDFPLVTLRNLGSSPAPSLQVSSSTGTLFSNCPATLATGAECAILLTAGPAGTLTATSGSVSTMFPYSAFTAETAANSIAVSPKELDFGIQTAASTSSVKTLTLTNLSAAFVTLNAGLVTSPKSTSPFSEQSSDCPLGSVTGTKTLAAGASCHVQVAFSTATSTSDGYVTGEWAVGPRQVMLTGYAQAASLSVSSSEVDFGSAFEGTPSLPRYLYLSNASTGDISHGTVSLPFNAPFQVTDSCPPTIRAGSVCRLRIDYSSSKAPSSDSETVQLDAGLSVVLTGSTLPPPSAGGSTVSPGFSVSPLSATFGDAVVVTGVSSATNTIGIMNAGTTDLPLSLALSGDFIQTTSCTSVLPAGATCAVALQFTPSQPGVRQGLLSVSSGSGTNPTNVALSGQGTAMIASNNGTLGFGSVPVGQPLIQYYKVTEPFPSLTAVANGPFSVTLIEDTGFGHGQPPASQFAPSASGTCHNCWVGVLFQPAAAGSQNGTVTFSSAALGLPYQLALQGIGMAVAGLTLSPAMQDFGSVPVNSASGVFSFTLTNGTVAPVTLGSIPLTGPFSSATTAGPACSGSIAVGASCTLGVAFAPITTGSQSGQLSVITSGGSVVAALSGIATADPGLAISPLALTFQNVSGASATTQSVTLQNPGPLPIVIGTPTSGTSSFTATTMCGTLSPGASCTITVQFTPASQVASDTLSIPATMQNSGGSASTTTYTVTLEGNYTAPNAGLQLSPTSASFGTTPTLSLGAIRQFTVGNTTQTTLALTVHMPQSYLLNGAPCTSIAAGASCTFGVQFAPAINGDIAGTVEVDAIPADGSASLATLAYAEGYGTGAGTLAISGGLIVNGVYAFGQASAGQPLTRTFTLQNTGTDTTAPAINVRRITSAPPFLATNTCTAALSSGANCTVAVTYAPTAASSTASSDVGSLTIDSDAQSSPTLLSLTGQPDSSATTGATTPLASYTLSQGSLVFSPVPVGDSSPPTTLTLTNTGTALLHISAASTTEDYAVQNGCAILSVGATCALTLTSTPQSLGDHLAALAISSDATDDLEYVSLFSNGSAPSLSISPGSLDFGPIQVGTSAQKAIQVLNTGALPVTFNSLQAIAAAFAVGGNCPVSGATLAAMASCTIQVTFAPTTAGKVAGSLAIASSATTSPLQVALTGQGIIPQLAAAPPSLDFGSVALGSSTNLPVILTNTSNAPVTTLSLAAAGDFAVLTPCPFASLMPGGTCQATLSFTPSTAGTQTGMLTIGSSDPTGPLQVALTGTGTPPPGFVLTVNSAAAATLTIQSGDFANFTLSVDSSNGFSGPVALTCSPTQLAPYAACSLLPPSVQIAATLGQSSTATVNTLDSGNGVARLRAFDLAPRDRAALAILFPGLMLLLRRRTTRLGRGVALSALLLTFFIAGCAGKNSSNLHYTPAGTYQFTVAATSTSAPQISQTVNLTVVVTPR